MIRIKRGLDLPITGLPSQKVEVAPQVSSVAVVGEEYNGMKPTMKVNEGDRVKVGQVLFEDKKNPGVLFTSPACGTIRAINRGERRAFQTIEIEVDGNEHVNFSSFLDKSLEDYSSEEAETLLVESGLWTAIRKRPFDKSPAIGSRPSSVFVSVIDSNPLAPNPDIVINENKNEFLDGLKVLSKFAKRALFVTKNSTSDIPEVNSIDKVQTEDFNGPHPAGLVGTHIHYLDPVNLSKTVWHVGYQDVIAIGHLFQKGKLFLERVVALAGPMVKNPILLRTRLGANIEELIKGKLKDGESRVISGSVFHGRTCDSVFKYLGRFDNQVSVLVDDKEREFLGWQGPGFDKYSVKNTYAGKFKKVAFPFSTKMFGSHRAMVPVGAFESVMPMDILPTQLLRALLSDDVDQAQALGVLELAEEDLALCTYVSPGKEDYGPHLRRTLNTIEKEG